MKLFSDTGKVTVRVLLNLSAAFDHNILLNLFETWEGLWLPVQAAQQTSHGTAQGMQEDNRPDRLLCEPLPHTRSQSAQGCPIPSMACLNQLSFVTLTDKMSHSHLRRLRTSACYKAALDSDITAITSHLCAFAVNEPPWRDQR
uniref:Uncharacterized protein n=1 Tax=Hippocampus comes TaxID=109280 RepID=A0A3Q2YZH0_HIPCM